MTSPLESNLLVQASNAYQASKAVDTQAHTPSVNAALHMLIQDALGPSQASAVATTAPSSSATAMYMATLQLFDSLLLLGDMIKNPPKVPTGVPNNNLLMAYTVFADAVVNWQTTYSAFVGNGGQPDGVTAVIESALTQAQPDGQSILQLSQAVKANPADWQQLQNGVSNQTLTTLFQDTNNWISVDQQAGGAGNPWWFETNSNAASVTKAFQYLNEILHIPPNPLDPWGNIPIVLNQLDDLKGALTQQNIESSPILTILWEMVNIPCFNINDLPGLSDDQPQSLIQILSFLNNYINTYGWDAMIMQLPSLQYQEAIESCSAVFEAALSVFGKAPPGPIN